MGFAALQRRFPHRQAAVPVLAWLVVIVFSHAVYQFFWYLPSWLEFRTPSEILAIASYVLALSLVESLLLLSGLLGLAALLPERLLRQRFAAQGTLIVWGFTAWAWLILAGLNNYLVQINRIQRLLPGGEMTFSMALLALMLLTLVLAPYFLARRLPRFEQGLLALGERISVFLYIYVPLGLLGLAVALLRNIL